jgi:hypothetical protein
LPKVASEFYPNILQLARYYQNEVGPLDVQAAEIKSKHLPNLQPEDVNRLSSLQARKEKFISSLVRSFGVQLGQSLTTKLQGHIDGYLKPRIESFQTQVTEAAHYRRGGAERVLNFLTVGYAPVAAQQTVGMNGYGHLYKDGWADYNQARVFGRGLVTEDYNNYGHTWSVETKVFNPSRTRVSSNLYQWYAATTSSTTSLPLEIDDGDFPIEIILKQICPFVLGLLALGTFPGPTVNVVPNVRVNPFGSFNPSTVTLGQSSAITLSLTASQNASATVRLEFSYIPEAGQPPINIRIGGSGLVSVSNGQTQTATALYTAEAITSSPTKIKATAIASNSDTVTSVRIINPEQTSGSVLTINGP